MGVVDAYRSARCPVLALLARRGGDLADRHSEVDALAEMIELEAVWFDTGHWISAEATEELADEVLQFAEPLR